MPQVCYQLFDTEIGVCGVAWTESGLHCVQLPEASPSFTEKRLRKRGALPNPCDPPAPVSACIHKLREYFDGHATEFEEVRLDFSAISRFEAHVYQLLRQTKFGQTITYGTLAKQAGHAHGARAVGFAMSRNPWPIVVPCHRVLAASGKLGGFSAHGGVALKRALLRMEGAMPVDPEPALPGLFDDTTSHQR